MGTLYSSMCCMLNTIPAKYILKFQDEILKMYPDRIIMKYSMTFTGQVTELSELYNLSKPWVLYIVLLYAQEVVTRPKILKRTILYN